MPAVVVTGARQTGKSTLVRDLLDDNRAWLTLDDMDVLQAIESDPSLVFDGMRPVAIDEIQRAPELLPGIKHAIDMNRAPGRFVLTGSANLLLMGGVSETLAGRAVYLTLSPMTRGEQSGAGRCGLWGRLFETPPERWIASIESAAFSNDNWRQLARRGGFPTPAVELETDKERAIWFDGYTRTYLERDLQFVSNISSIPDFRRLMRAVCLRTGQILNQTELGRDVAIPQPTVHRWLNVLELSHLLVRLPAWSVNRTKRLIKSPKVYWGDTGLGMHLAGVTEPTGAHLENVILLDILTWASAEPVHTNVFYWRTTAGEEIDFLIETAAGVMPIEIKSGAKVKLSDTKHLRSFRQEHTGVALPGLLLHDGDRTEWLTDDVLAVPWWRML